MHLVRVSDERPSTGEGKSGVIFLTEHVRWMHSLCFTVWTDVWSGFPQKWGREGKVVVTSRIMWPSKKLFFFFAVFLPSSSMPDESVR